MTCAVPMATSPPNSTGGCLQGVGIEMKMATLHSVVAGLECGPSPESLGRSWVFVVPPRDANPTLLLDSTGRTVFWRSDGKRVES